MSSLQIKSLPEGKPNQAFLGIGRKSEPNPHQMTKVCNGGNPLNSMAE